MLLYTAYSTVPSIVPTNSTDTTYTIPKTYPPHIIVPLSIEATGAPLGDIPTVFFLSCPVPPPVLTPRKSSTEDPSTALPTQLYTSIYFLRSITPHKPYITL